MEKTCKYFLGDRPCKKYWSEKLYEGGELDCSERCKHYKKIEKRILLIKIDALGDVLRTTPLVEAIKKQHPDSHLTWLTGESSLPFLKNNPYIDRVLKYEFVNVNSLTSEYFDILINLDKDKKATFLANKIKSKDKRGFLLYRTGVPVPANKGAEKLYKIALDNWGEKTKNKQNFHELTYAAAEILYGDEDYFLKLDKEDEDFAEKFKKKLVKNKKIVGINIGCGPVYPHKKWTKDGIIKLVEKLNLEGRQVILFGGADEEILYKEISKKVKVVSAGINNSIMQFAALLNLCDVVFTGDTVSLHIAIALDKPIVSVFGPTPSQEIRLRRGVKLVGKVSCLNCYDQFPCLMEKEKKLNCMQSITVDEVLNAINKYL